MRTIREMRCCCLRCRKGKSESEREREKERERQPDRKREFTDSSPFIPHMINWFEIFSGTNVKYQELDPSKRDRVLQIGSTATENRFLKIVFDEFSKLYQSSSSRIFQRSFFWFLFFDPRLSCFFLKVLLAQKKKKKKQNSKT